MTDSDDEDLKSETLEYQYELVKKETNLSHVMQFGDKDIAKEAVALFQGDKEDREYTDNFVSFLFPWKLCQVSCRNAKHQSQSIGRLVTSSWIIWHGSTKRPTI